jgi:leucyl/phenylalanyl-tRNA--protein transferase
MTSHTAPPRGLGPSRWILPAPETADEHGVIGVGADLEPSTLVEAYRNGIFPWPHDDVPLPWFSPDPRGVIEPHGVHVSRSLRAVLRTSGWATTIDHDFDGVVAGCRDRPGEGTWITDEMVAAYRALHQLGWAHSIEVWDGDDLVGGLYGMLVGGVFTGESMFHRVSNASKVALVDFANRFALAGGVLLDAQLRTPHLVSMGLVEVARSTFLEILRAVRDDDIRLRRDRLDVDRLA